jgi:hypothetical protein
MQPAGDTATVGFPAASPRSPRIQWFMVIGGCLYFLWLAVSSTKTIQIFAKLFASLGVELPLPTRILLSHFSHFYFLPTVFTVAAMLTVATKLAEFSRRQLGVINFVLIVIGAVLPPLLALFLYLPLFVLIGKLKGAH